MKEKAESTSTLNCLSMSENEEDFKNDKNQLLQRLDDMKRVIDGYNSYKHSIMPTTITSKQEPDEKLELKCFQ